MLTIRLQRIGRRNEPHFRVVVAEHTMGPKSGKFVEQVGFRNPKTKEQKLDVQRIKYWVSVGAQPTDTVYNLLVKEGIVEGRAKNVLPQKSPVVKEEEPAEEKKESNDKAQDDSAEESSDAAQDDSAESEEKPSEETGDAEEGATEASEESAPAQDSKEEEAAPAEEEKKEG